MKTNSKTLRNAILLFAAVLAFSGGRANGQGVATAQSFSQQKFVPARVTEAVDDAKTVTLKGNVHPLARAEFDQGPVSDAMPATRMLLLLQRSPAQETALRQLLDQQQDKTSSNYHAWLTPQQFATQFGPADADIQAITGWLQSHGFQNVKVGAGRTTIEFSGNAGQIRNAFHTDIHQFLVHGVQHIANVSDPQIPAALTPVISGVIGLHNFRPKSQMHRATNFQSTEAKVIRTKPSVTFTGCGPSGTQECYGVAPADFAKIYSVPGTLTGAGVNIAIVQDSNLNLSDIQQFRTLFNLPSNFTASNIIFNGPDPGVLGPDSPTFDEGEAVLDVEWSGAVAPGATIQLVVSEDSETFGAAGIDLSAVYIIDNNIAPIMSESFGACEEALGSSGVSFYGTLWEQAASQGITAILSAGDSGSDGCDAGSGDFATRGLGISGLASTPFNVAMGGTDFQNGASPSVYWSTTGTAIESALSYIPEEPWNSSCAATATNGSLGTCTASIINADSLNEDGIDLAGGSGGESAFVAKPSWQTGVTPAGDTFRDIPDLSLFSAVNTSNNDFYITCEQDAPSQNGEACSLAAGQKPEISPVGGTSAAAPAFAGIMALIVQQQGGNTAGRQGNANFVLYQLFKKDASNATLVCPSTAANVTTSSCIFYDVVTGNNSVACQSDTTNCSNKSTAANQYGVLVDPSNTNNPAFLAVQGYDKATGLGSVNVTNLAKAWSSATFDSTTTAITTSPTGTIAHGATVSFTVKVTSTSGTPTGNVSLIASPPGSAPTSIGPFTNTTTSTFALSGGTATITTNLLPGYVVGGVPTAYPVVAQYAGDGTFGAGTSVPVNVTVGQEGSATAITLVGGATATSVVYGSSYITRVDVVGTGTNSGSQECSATFTIPCPTGSISLTDNGTNLNDFQNTQTGTSSNTANLLNDFGFLEDQLVQLPGGSNSLVAKYSGDSSYTTSTSPALVVTVTPATTAASVTASATSATTVTPVTLTALIATQSSGAGPTGTVTFSANGSSIGTANAVPTAAAGLNTTTPVAAFSTATLSHTFATTGTYSISVSYATGDLNYSNSSSSGTGNFSLTITQGTTGNFAVSYAPASLTLSSATGASQSTMVTVTPSGGFTGMVGVTASTSVPGVTCTPSPLNINVTGATAVTGQLSCSVLATSTTLTASNASQDRMLRAKTTPPSKGDKGWWTLSAGSGFAALFLMFLPGGRKRYRAALGLGLVCILSFTLGCGGGYSPPPPPPPTSTVTKLTVTNAKVASGNAFSFSVSVTGGTPTGQVQLFDGSTMIGTAATVAGGTAAPTAPALAVGTHAISAHYLGDANTAASASGAINMTVTGTTTVAITTSPAATPAAPALSVTIN
jgi:uncharacterized membrane protein